ncbi:MAG: hypothetical protein IGS38_16260 [Synechococcales cyanobacterium M58_A2018_015]|nr:hypothetical protein [Synechococcales cyanobacterium M58_A2018_015]
MRRWQQIGQMLASYWLTERRGLGLLLLVALSMGSSGFLIWETLQRGELLSALAARDRPRFLRGVWLFLGIMVASSPALSFKTYLQDKLANHWRYWLTNQFQQRYFANRAFYYIGSFVGFTGSTSNPEIDNLEIDNPDQRIVEDIRNVTQQSLNLLVISFDSAVQFFGFVAVLWLISKSLLAVLLTYAIVGTFVTSLLFGRVLVGINTEQLKREADFRFHLMRVRENAEMIAFYQGQAQESEQVWQRFLAAFRNINHLIRWQLGLNLFQNSYQYLTFLLPALILSPAILSGQQEIGVEVQASTAFRIILLALALVIKQFEQLTALVASIERLDALDTSTLSLSKQEIALVIPVL